MNILNIEHISKIYGEKVIFDDVSLGIHSGDKIGVIGVNGTGKTTLLKIIAKINEPDKGQIICGNGIRVSYLPQNPEFPKKQSILEYVMDGKEHQDWKTESEAKTILTKLGIYDFDEGCDHLSGGQKKRVALARTLVDPTEVLILDEPMVGLDPQQIIEVRDLILDLKQSHTVILSSHILPEIQSVCDRVVVLNEGSLVADDTPEHLSAKLSAASRLRLRVAAPAESVIQLLKTIRDVETVTQQNPQEPGCCELLIEAAQGSDIRRAVFCRLSERQYPILYMALEEMTLESIFLSLTGNG